SFLARVSFPWPASELAVFPGALGLALRAHSSTASGTEADQRDFVYRASVHGPSMNLTRWGVKVN
ncbi:MAG: hypothetical protein DMG09_24760, partial [Acidobacteria bacterium]